MMKDSFLLAIGKKIAAGFGIILALLVAIVVIIYTGVSGIVDNADEMITSKKIDSFLAQIESDHLKWVNELSALFIHDSVTEVDVETDDHKCGLGKGLYGEGRKEAEKVFPSIASLLKSLKNIIIVCMYQPSKLAKNTNGLNTYKLKRIRINQ